MKISIRSLAVLILLCASATTHAQKKKTVSHYYDLNNNKIEGKIWMGAHANGRNPFIEFESDSIKRLRLYTHMIRSFVYKTDSFIVKPHTEPDPDAKFYHVLLNGQIKLYAYYRKVGSPSTFSYGAISFYVGSGGKGYFSVGPDIESAVPLTRENWRDYMIALVASEPSIVAQIKDKTYVFSEIGEIIDDYRAIKKLRAAKKK